MFFYKIFLFEFIIGVIIDYYNIKKEMEMVKKLFNKEMLVII